jgi:hypothetical protein
MDVTRPALIRPNLPECSHAVGIALREDHHVSGLGVSGETGTVYRTAPGRARL